MSKTYIITGMPGAGKEEFAQVAVELGYELIRMGDVVRNEASKQNICMDDRGVGGFASDERQKYGADIWAKRCLPYITKNSVIDGCRSIAEMNLFRSEIGKNCILVAIEAPADMRYDRLQKRNRYDAPKNREDFEARDSREIGWGLKELMNSADKTITNSESIESFRETVRAELSYD